MNHDDVLENRAQLLDAKPADDLPRCPEHLLFALRDKHHTFSLDIVTLLQCLQWAEQEGGIPELPVEWWENVLRRYPLSVCG
ncbi:hypothetical protein ACFOJE_16490 [Azotobacter bryophylli]|jgi:hypothetical protein|uniref:Uncharacterized protein n=1 Tax=Azotobacter bryophylli TaxID=1986537 RepID=A0ABV7AWJ7_9GAMM